jgi:hypothetical protein
MTQITNMRELHADELDVVTGGLTVVGGSGSLVDISATGTAVQGILGSVGSLLTGLITTASSTASSTGSGLLG